MSPFFDSFCPECALQGVVGVGRVVEEKAGQGWLWGRFWVEIDVGIGIGEDFCGKNSLILKYLFYICAW